MIDKNGNQLSSSEIVDSKVVLSTDQSDNNAPVESDLGSPLKDLTWRDGAEILADAANLIPLAGPMLATASKKVCGLGEHSPKERLKEKQFEWLIAQVSEILKKLDVLAKLPKDERPEAADVAATIEAALEVSRKTADAKKRRLLRNAIVNAFDVEQYQTGLTLRLFSILQEVEYGEVELLRRIADASDAVGIKSLEPYNPAALTYHHLEILGKQNLVQIWNRETTTPLGMNTNSHTRITELGRRFLQFVAEAGEVETS